ncbi:unnamed protein product [Dovyalis caffra]|uniref:Uncharacterized protein n=1 Tax=Dovyalis caffra TaxID=77055 RepID=A0AAV1SUH0_9ROSI|nr:unnamed protein product [Dovyalis caffra]
MTHFLELTHHIEHHEIIWNTWRKETRAAPKSNKHKSKKALSPGIIGSQVCQAAGPQRILYQTVQETAASIPLASVLYLETLNIGKVCIVNSPTSLLQ